MKILVQSDSRTGVSEVNFKFTARELRYLKNFDATGFSEPTLFIDLLLMSKESSQWLDGYEVDEQTRSLVLQGLWNVVLNRNGTTGNFGPSKKEKSCQA